MSQEGVAVAAVTAKDKLRRMLGKGIAIGPGSRNGGICFSSEQADRCTLEEHGIDGVDSLVGRPKPDMYSADLSLFVLDAGIRLVEQGRADLFTSRCPITCSTAMRPTSQRRSTSTLRSTSGWRGWRRWAAPSR